jgi:hypothetical protein
MIPFSVVPFVAAFCYESLTCIITTSTSFMQSKPSHNDQDVDCHLDGYAVQPLADGVQDFLLCNRAATSIATHATLSGPCNVRENEEIIYQSGLQIQTIIPLTTGALATDHHHFLHTYCKYLSILLISPHLLEHDPS